MPKNTHKNTDSVILFCKDSPKANSTGLFAFSLIRGHLFSTYARRGEEVEQKRTPCVQGERWVDTSKYVRKKAFYHSLLFLVATFIAELKAFTIIIALSLKCFTVFSLLNIALDRPHYYSKQHYNALRDQPSKAAKPWQKLKKRKYPFVLLP